MMVIGIKSGFMGDPNALPANNFDISWRFLGVMAMADYPFRN
jgi:hypothetical protein